MILHETLKENWKCHKKINWIYKQCHPINYLRMTILFTVELVSLFRFLSRNSSMRSSRLIIIIVVRSHVVFISWYIGCTITYCRLHICSGAYNLCVNVLQVFAKFVRIHGHQVECFFVLFIMYVDENNSTFVLRRIRRSMVDHTLKMVNAFSAIAKMGRYNLEPTEKLINIGQFTRGIRHHFSLRDNWTSCSQINWRLS